MTFSVNTLSTMAETISALSLRSSSISKEAIVATNDGDLRLAEILLARARGINEAVTAMLAVVTAAAEATR